MNRSFITTVFAVLALSGVVFGLFEKYRASELEAEKETLVKLADAQQLRAEEFQKMAAIAQQEALVQRTICEEQLKDALRKAQDAVQKAEDFIQAKQQKSKK